MAELTADIAPQVLAACTENAEEAAGAIGRALDGDFVVKPGEASSYEAGAHAEEGQPLAGPGLAVTFTFGSGDEAIGAVACLADSSGLLPAWVRAPDPTGESKLSTLAQELSMLLMPDDLMADAFHAAWVDDLSAAVGHGEPSDGAAALPIELVQGESLGELRLLWPIAKPGAVHGAETASTEGSEDAASSEVPTPETEEATEADEASPATTIESEAVPEKSVSKARVHRWGPAPRDYRDLPPNTRSVLRVQVPVSVNLAGKKMSIDEIVSLGPGAIITFDKACDDSLEVTVGGQTIAQADAVKVGEKFGVRVSKMVMPEEHFRKLLPPKAS